MVRVVVEVVRLRVVRVRVVRRLLVMKVPKWWKMFFCGFMAILSL